MGEGEGAGAGAAAAEARREGSAMAVVVRWLRATQQTAERRAQTATADRLRPARCRRQHGERGRGCESGVAGEGEEVLRALAGRLAVSGRDLSGRREHAASGPG